MSGEGAKEEIAGKRFGRLVALYEVPENERKDKRFREYVCRCDCGTVKSCRRDNLRNNRSRSCGCLQKDTTKLNLEKHRRDIIGKRFGRLVVSSEVPKSEWKNKKHREFFCVCDCGDITKVARGALMSGGTKSCGCLKRDVVQNQGEDLTGQTFGELTAIRRVKSHVTESGERLTRWIFRCSCGREVELSINNVKSGGTKSCGHIGKSLAEYEINKWLMDNHVYFDIQVTFDDLRNPDTGKNLRFDYKIYRKDGSFFIVEHHGVQHFRETEDGFGKLQRETTDKIKKDYCKAKGITLYETLYNEDYISKLEKIIEYEVNREGDVHESEVKTG